jgi:hypothetical protein
MKVLFISLAFPPAPSQAGVVCAKNAIALSEIGNEVDVLTCAIPYGVQWEAGMREAFEASGLRIIRPEETWRHRLGLLGRSGRLRHFSAYLWYCLSRFVPFDPSLIHFRSVWKALRTLELTGYDCVVTWSPFYSVNLIGALIKRLHPSVIWVAQFSDPWCRNPLETRWLVRQYARFFEPRSLKHCNGLIYSSGRALESILSRWGWEGKKTFLLRHGFIDKFYGAESPRGYERYATSKLRFVGTLFGKRTPIPLFRALGKIVEEEPEEASQLSVSLVGPIDVAFLRHPALTSLPDGLVCVDAPVPYLESLRRMRESDGLLLIEAPVTKNQFVPSKLADYLGAQRPILAFTRDPELLETVRAAGGRTADPESVEDIAKTLLAFIRGEVAAPERDAENVRKFDARVCASELQVFLESVMAHETAE